MRDCFACKFWLKLVSWFWRRPFLNFVNVFFTILLSSPFGIRWNPSFEQIWIPITQECFVPSLVEIGPLILENFFNLFLLFCFYLPLEKGVTHYLNKLKSPSPMDVLCQVWLKLALGFWIRRQKCENFMKTIMTHNFQSEELGWVNYSRGNPI